jgi:hypothetical protein
MTRLFVDLLDINQPLLTTSRLSFFAPGVIRGRSRALWRSPTQTNLAPTHKQLHVPVIYVNTLFPRLVKTKSTKCRNAEGKSSVETT